MNFASKLWLSPCAALLAGMILSGCGSTDEPLFSDNPGPPGATTSPATLPPQAGSPATPAPMTSTDAPRFSVGETVIVGMTTSSTDPNPPSATQRYLVNENGTITLPLIGPVQAAGKTPGELQSEIHDLYVPGYYVRLTVTVTTENQVYYVGGEVGHSGAQVYLGETTVSKAIQAAGDFTEFAKHKVWLIRKDGTRVKVDINKALRDATKDPAVFPGDQIYVPRRIF